MAKSVKKHRRGVSWRHVESFLADLENILGILCAKNWQATAFFKKKFFDTSVVQVGVLAAMLADVGFKLGVFGSSWGDLGACWRQDGRQERQDGDQERQDEPR